MRIHLAALLGMAAATLACGERQSSAPWLTYPGVAGHTYLRLAGTPHDPSAPGSTVDCQGCHSGSTFTQFSCTGCHGQAECDPIHQGTVPGYAWQSASCYHCHPDGLGVMEDHGTRFFPIGTASHPAVCTSCHTDLSNRTPATLACATCHLGRPAFAGQHAAVADFPPAPTGADCVRCHADGQVTRLADHAGAGSGTPVPTFPVPAGSASHGTSCLQCHTALRSDRAWATDFSAYDCLSCHAHSDQVATTASHAGVSGFAYQSSACFGCHPDGQGAPANHTPDFFPIGTGTRHAGITCRQCHLDLARPHDATQFACDSCHLSNAADPGFSTTHTAHPSGVAILTVHTGENTTGPPLTLTSPNCLRCHADGQVDLVSAHPAGDRGFGQGDHRRAGCVTCHTAMRTGTKSFGASWDSATGCTTCHRNGIPN